MAYSSKILMLAARSMSAIHKLSEAPDTPRNEAHPAHVATGVYPASLKESLKLDSRLDYRVWIAPGFQKNGGRTNGIQKLSQFKVTALC
ncbi:MAG: hypothetical protein WC091_21440 [Sulfuricellaceae bacterium]